MKKVIVWGCVIVLLSAFTGACSWVGRTAGKVQAKVERKAEAVKEGYHEGYESERAGKDKEKDD